MGTRWHNHGTPGGDYPTHVDMWMDHYLKGVDNGIDKLPSVISQTSDYEGPLGFKKGMPKTTPVTLIPQEAFLGNTYPWSLLPSEPVFFPGFAPTAARFLSVGINTESHANHHAQDKHDWWWFESPMLKKDTRIFGEIKLRIWSTVYRKYITVTPSVIDINPEQHVAVGNNHVASCDAEGIENDDNECTEALVAVTRGFLDSRYRDGLDKEVDLEPGKSTEMTVVMKPQDYVFRKGHMIGLQIATEILEWHLPKPAAACEGFDPTAVDPNNPSGPECAYFQIDWTKGQTKLILPVVNAPKDHSDLFDLMAGHDH